jgi:hypothetical protein
MNDKQTRRENFQRKQKIQLLLHDFHIKGTAMPSVSAQVLIGKRNEGHRIALRTSFRL